MPLYGYLLRLHALFHLKIVQVKFLVGGEPCVVNE
jgi:hypothetical protein